MKKISIVAFAAFLLVGCATQFEVKPSIPLNVDVSGKQKVYHASVTYYNQNDFGITESIDEIDARVLRVALQGTSYYKWISYKIRSFRPAESIAAKMEYRTDSAEKWRDYQPAVGFDYLMEGIAVDENGNLSKIPNVDSIPRDMDGFKFYVSLIDFHSWDIYRHTFFNPAELKLNERPLKKVGDTVTVSLEAKPIPLLEWENLTSDLRMEGGIIVGLYLADGVVNGTESRIVYFEQNQRIKQYVYGSVGGILLKMPYEGTTRFFGHIFVDQSDELLKAHFNEYVYGKVSAPMGVKVIVHTKREYRVEVE